MAPPTLTSRHALLAVLVAGTLALSVGACGRRGRPEPPPLPGAENSESGKGSAARSGKAQPTFQTRPGTVAQNDDDDDDDDDDSAGVSPQPVPTSKKKRQPYVVPKQPFFLDPLL